jgi:hypothetical protein
MPKATPNPRIVPRTKELNGFALKPAPVLLTAQCLQEHFIFPLNEAAKMLGVCETSLKTACRKVGIKNWPYRKVNCAN